MRVVHVNAGNLFGGVESLLLTIARYRAHSPALQHEFAICFEGRLSEELRELDAPVHMLGEVKVRRPWTIRTARTRLSKAIGEGRSTVVMGHAPWPYALAAPAAGAARRVLFVHNPMQGHHWVERWAHLTPPDLIITNSQFTQLSSDLPFDNVPTRVLNCPVGPPEGVPSDARDVVRAELGTTADATVIVLAARMEEWKGHRLLIQALALLKDDLSWEGWIAGGSQRPHEERYVEQLHREVALAGLSERVRFLGQRSDIPKLLAASDVHCQPNTGPEPFGVAFVEALYAGLPVVTTAQGGALEIVDESCGRFVDPGDPDASTLR